MRTLTKISLLAASTAAIALFTAPAVARHGADDPLGHCRKCDDPVPNAVQAADRSVDISQSRGSDDRGIDMQRGRGSDDVTPDDRGHDANDANDDRGQDANDANDDRGQDANDANDDRGQDANDADDLNDDNGVDVNDVDDVNDDGPR